MTVQRAWELNLKKEPKPTRQHIIIIVKRFQETGSLLPRPKKKKMVATQKIRVQNTMSELICQCQICQSEK